MTKYPNLFSSFTIRNTTFRNRIFASPILMTWPDYDGTPQLTGLFFNEDKARGGAAMISMGETVVNRTHACRGNPSFITPAEGRAGYASPSDMLIKNADAIRRHGAVPEIQLLHGGNQMAAQFVTEKRRPIGPVGFTRKDGIEVVQMDEALMQEVCDDFENAAKIARTCGFGAIQIHGGHGWLLSQFLSPLDNHRTDGYGGSLQNRAKFPMRVIDAVRKGAGPDMIIEYRISGDEHADGGMKVDEVAEFGVMIQDKVDIIHVSAGSYWGASNYLFPSIYQPHNMNLPDAAVVKKKVRIPVSVVGAIYDPDDMERFISEGMVDFVCLCRALVADPDLPKKAYYGKKDDVRPCIRCVNCLGRKYDGHHNCDVNPITGNETYTLRVPPVRNRQRVLVVGGGPAGLTAAATAAERGHEVVLVEQTDSLGGILKLTEVDSHKHDLRRFKDWMIRQVHKSNVDVRLNTKATPELLDKLKPDAVIVASGSSPITPQFKGMDKKTAMHAIEVYTDIDRVGKEVVMVGGGLAGCEVALHLAEIGRKVTIVEMMDEVVPLRDTNRVHRDAVMEQLDKHVPYLTLTTCKEITAEGVIVVDKEGKEKLLPCDTVVYAVGMRANKEIVEELRAAFGWVTPVGDCEGPATVRKAIHHGYFAAMDII
jgi:2,4-dienoyl-CoA reductase-like NADH-dependent reductase (Old Yellow Enzyme family)/thioredoxin reductase